MLQMRKQHKTNESLLQISGNHKSKNHILYQFVLNFQGTNKIKYQKGAFDTLILYSKG